MPHDAPDDCVHPERPRTPASRTHSEEELPHVSSEPPSPTALSSAPGERSRPRPILCKSHSVDVAPLSSSAEKRSVSFRLPEHPHDHRSHGKMAALAQSLKKLTLAAAASEKSKPEKAPKRILRQPVVHVYVRGASGLPTQRVPLAAVNALHRQHLRASIS
ncbi:hypothetical protein FJT64_016879 [Amphibalanus amphitrite]|uniref:DUF4797 domain-containing protein n=1 Tax=Amphibalanus amphitrite TaxID=1232801 RepID=A0A6A4XDE5_AMPAM|nr:hypothetical protein FJT64_016879 [Amphibalanus amphitrite]